MKERPNILYILVDQQRVDMLGAYGNKIVKTPHIDNLAEDGILFTQAFTPTALCGPARTSLFTGLFPTSHGVVRNAEDSNVHMEKADPIPSIPTLSDYLTGYEKIFLGKWHIAETKLPRDYGFKGNNFAGYGFPGSRLYKNFTFDQGPGKENEYRDWLLKNGFEIPEVTDIFFGNNPNLRTQELKALLSGPEEASIPYFLMDESIRYINEAVATENPFFLWLNFWGPHSPCLVPEPYYSMYDPKIIPEDPAFRETFENKPVQQEHVSRMWGVYDLSWEGWQEIIARYFGYITLIDNCIGNIIQHLKKEGVYDNTFIVFTADHGDNMGANRLIEKGEFMYDASYRIPMILRDPASPERGKRCDEFIYLHDLFPTAVELAGAEPSEHIQSKSLLPLIRGKTDSMKRDHVYAQFTAHFADYSQRMIRTRKHKFVFNAPSFGELYDLEKDPHELNNLIDNAEYADVKRDLIYRLMDEMRELDDPLLGWFSRIRDEY